LLAGAPPAASPRAAERRAGARHELNPFYGEDDDDSPAARQQRNAALVAFAIVGILLGALVYGLVKMSAPDKGQPAPAQQVAQQQPAPQPAPPPGFLKRRPAPNPAPEPLVRREAAVPAQGPELPEAKVPEPRPEPP
jgi:hypothetical protein